MLLRFIIFSSLESERGKVGEKNNSSDFLSNFQQAVDSYCALTPATNYSLSIYKIFIYIYIPERWKSWPCARTTRNFTRHFSASGSAGAGNAFAPRQRGQNNYLHLRLLSWKYTQRKSNNNRALKVSSRGVGLISWRRHVNCAHNTEEMDTHTRAALRKVEHKELLAAHTARERVSSNQYRERARGGEREVLMSMQPARFGIICETQFGPDCEAGRGLIAAVPFAPPNEPHSRREKRSEIKACES